MKAIKYKVKILSTATIRKQLKESQALTRVPHGQGSLYTEQKVLIPVGENKAFLLILHSSSSEWANDLMCICLEISPTLFNGTHSQISVHRITALIPVLGKA